MTIDSLRRATRAQTRRRPVSSERQTIRRRQFTALMGAGVLWPLVARANLDRQLPCVGVLTGNIAADQGAQMRVQAFRQALADLGWVENQNVRLEVRWPGPGTARQEHDARELVALEPDVILVTSTPTARAVRDATQKIPVVFVGLSDPVANGVVSNLARPTGNITG